MKDEEIKVEFIGSRPELRTRRHHSTSPHLVLLFCFLRRVKSRGVFIIMRKLKRIHRDGCRYNERLNGNMKGSKRLVCTGLLG